MAISKGILKMTGGFGTASCYSLHGSDQMIIRAKGGPSARRMKEGSEFAMVRRHQSEWKACVMFSQALKRALGDVYRLADYNVSPVWNGLGKNIVKTDAVNALGERSLLASAYKQELHGFSLNRNYALNALFAVQPELVVDIENMYASVTFTSFNSEREILNVRKLPYFRIKVCLGILSDIHFEADNYGGKYKAIQERANGISQDASTEWLCTNDIVPELKLEVQYKDAEIFNEKDNLSYILSMGIEFGNVGFGGKIESVKYAGAGKIIGVY